MAESSVAITVSDFWDDGKRIHVCGQVFIGASPGTYSTGGVGLDIAALIQSQVPGITSAQSPVRVDAKGISGYKYEIDKVLKKLLIRTSAGFTPAGSIAVTDGAVTVLGGAAGTALGITADSNSGALTKAAATTRTIPQATFGIAATTAALTGTAVAAAAMAELAAAAMPAGVSSDTIDLYAIFKKFQ